MIEHVLQFDSAAHFLRDYETHLVHGGLLLSISPAPDVYTKIKLTLVLPPDQVSLSVEATVVAPLPDGVGVQLSPFDELGKEVLERQIQLCKALPEELAAQPSSPSLPAQTSVDLAAVGREETSSGAELAALRQSAELEATEQEGPPPSSVSSIDALPSETFNRSMLHKGNHPDLGSLESFLLPDEVTNPRLMRSQFVPPPAAPEPALAPAPHLRRAPVTRPAMRPQEEALEPSMAAPPEPLSAELQGTIPTAEPALLSPDESQLDYFPPEEIEKESLTSREGIASVGLGSAANRPGVSVEPGQTGWNQSPSSSPDHLSVSAMDWPAAGGYSYDSLPAAHFTPPPDSLPAPITPTTTAPSLTGDLDGTACLDMLLSLGAQSATGMLHFLAMDGTYNVFFHQGRVVCITEEPTPDKRLLGQILIDLGHITPVDRDAVMSKVRPHDQKFGEALVEDGVLTLREIAQALRRQLQKRIGVLAALVEGHYTFYEKRLPSKKVPLAPPTTPARLLFRALINTYGKRLREEARPLEEPYLPQFVVRSEDPPCTIDELKLSANEETFWNELLTGQLILRDVYKASTFSRRRTHATLFAFYDLGLIQFQPEIDDDWKTRELSEFYQKRCRMIGKESYFHFLGLHWSASKADIEEAYTRLYQEYDLTQEEGDFPESLAAMSKAILAHLDEAKKHLASGAGRQGYRNSISARTQLGVSLEMLTDQADMAIYRKDYAEAIARITQAIELAPEDEDLKKKLAQLKVLQREKASRATGEIKGFALEVDWERLNKEPPKK